MNGRIIKKRIHVRVEHVVPSRCREDFLKRRATHEELKKDAKEQGSASFAGLLIVPRIFLLRWYS